MVLRRCLILVVLSAALALVSLASASPAHASVVWLCHPGQSPDPCDMSLATTDVAPSGARTTQTPAVSPNQQKVDCFYVYPTVSNQVGLNATQTAAPEVVSVTQYQAGRFTSQCQMYVPLYRQITVANVLSNGLPVGSFQIAYSDVLEAWKAFLAQTDGRPFIILGHSQGSILLRKLIREQVDPDAALRTRLVGAFLLGGNVTTRAGQTTGGDFQHIPLCTVKGQDGCVVAYSTFDTDPGAVSFFGNTNTDLLSGALGTPHGAGYQIACTDPGTLSGDSGAFPATVPTTPFAPGFIASGIAVILSHAHLPTVSTPWVSTFRYTGLCQTINGAHVYHYQPVDGSPQLNDFPPEWGTHIADYQLGTDRLITIAGLEEQTWMAANQLKVTVNHTRATLRRAVALRVTVSVTQNGVVTPVPGAHIVLGNDRTLVTNSRGQASTTVTFGKRGSRRVLASAAGYLGSGATITVR